ncbi:MAG: lipopolysaccharide heptosyltransferase II [Planctomycetota bacterium]|jgi:heptosyltransferase-2
MLETKHKILVWLPSPMGDAVLCTPALRAIRRHFTSSQIAFLAGPVVRQVLSPSSLNDIWLEQHSRNPFAAARMLRSHKFTHAILLKNSFTSALTAFLARIPNRIGYAREGRSIFLTHKLYPPRLPGGKFKPVPIIDYYLAVAETLGADCADRTIELSLDREDQLQVSDKIPELAGPNATVVILVPGGAFGPSKCWPAERFAQTADWLITNYDATVVVSVAANPAEKCIADEICNSSAHNLISLAERPLTIGQLKALFASADLVMSNDTGPRHIAIALKRKVVSLFGPNDPAWTQTGYENEIQIIGDVPCAPCRKPICKKPEHLCMQAISVEMVCQAAKKLLTNQSQPPACRTQRQFVQLSDSFFAAPDYLTALRQRGLTSLEAVFSFTAAVDLTKKSLAAHRSRLRFEIDSPPTVLFLKRYDRPPITSQLKNWLALHRRSGCGPAEYETAATLSTMRINTPKTVAYGEQRGKLFEKRSFIITQKIADAESLERKLPDCFDCDLTAENLKSRRDFIAALAKFVRDFHRAGYRHRDLYFSHIFYGDGQFYLIDLARAFKPAILAERYRRKDIAQLHYSAPAAHFSKTDRLRFYFGYAGRRKLAKENKLFIHSVVSRARRMARHNKKHGRPIPFEGPPR